VSDFTGLSDVFEMTGNVSAVFWNEKPEHGFSVSRLKDRKTGRKGGRPSGKAASIGKS